MNPMARLIDWLFEPAERTADADEDFLAASVDFADLERRMRLLDGRREIGPFGLNA